MKFVILPRANFLTSTTVGNASLRCNGVVYTRGSQTHVQCSDISDVEDSRSEAAQIIISLTHLFEGGISLGCVLES